MRPDRTVSVVVAGLLTVAVAGCTANANTAATTGASPASSAGVPPGAGQLQQEYEALVTRVLPSVVQINTATGLGSGVVYDTRGDIVTNAHVVGTSTTFQVSLATNGTQLRGTLVGTYPAGDLAVIKVDDPNAVHPAAFGDSSAVKVGQLVLAMGNPLGLQASVTDGIVSAVGRTVGEPSGSGSPGATITDAIQTSAAINPGNSGGALVDMAGDVIGIPTLGAVDPAMGSTAAGIGFAIPSATAKRIADQLIATGSSGAAGRAALDVTVRGVLDQNLRPAGVAVMSVRAGGAAAKAGIVTGSVITAVNGAATPTVSALNEVLATLRPGQDVTVNVIKPDGTKDSVTVTLDTLGNG
jgi:S1-C subfamily serine protease